jgi:hypothetical protein
MANSNSGPTIISHGIVAGQTVSAWTKEWYTWAFQSPSNVSPFTPDSTGDGSGGFDAGRMFFIAGFDTSNGPLNVTVPFGKPILVPLLNFADTLDSKSTENGLISDFTKGASGLFATLDGKALDHLQADLVRTDFFSAGPTRPGSWANDQGVAPGTDLTPTKGAGYYIVIEGLSKGTHTLEFGGNSASTKTTIDTHDILHIV